MNFIKKSLVLVVYLLLAVFAVLSQVDPHKGSHIDFFSAYDYRQGSSQPVTTIDRFGLPFKFLIAYGVTSPFTLDVTLKPTSEFGLRSLWLYEAQAVDHSKLEIKVNGDRIVTEIDNRLPGPHVAPVEALKYIGDIDVTRDPIEVKITSRNDALEVHFIELGLFILAPPGATQEEILNNIKTIDAGQVFDIDIGALLIPLFLAFLSLVYFSRSTHVLIQGVNLNTVYSAIVLSSIALGSLYAYIYAAPVVTGHTDKEIGVTRLSHGYYFGRSVNEQFTRALNAVNELQARVFPSHAIKDNVPEKLKESKGSFETTIYSLDKKHDFSTVADKIWSGKLKEIQRIPEKYFVNPIIVLVNLIGLTILLSGFFKTKWLTASIGLAAISALSCLLSIRLANISDSVFVNLRHAYMLLHHGMFSINNSQWIEATVETLPLLITTVFGLFGIDLLDSYLAVVLSGNIFIIALAYIFVRKLTLSHSWALVSAALIGLYPNVLWVGTTAFAAVPFTCVFLAGSYFLLFSERKKLGLFFLSMLTFMRIEGILFAALIMIYTHVLKPLFPSIKSQNLKPYFIKMGMEGSLVAGPFLIVTSLRFFIYGSLLPVPILFNNNGFDKFHITRGIDTFAQMAILYGLPLLILCILFLGCLSIINNVLSKSKFISSIGLDLIALNSVCLLAMVPYFLEGGDWFPAQWNRYGLSFNIVLLLTFMVLLYHVFLSLNPKKLRIAALIVFGGGFLIIHMHSVMYYGANYIPLTIKALKDPPSSSWNRVDKLAQLGQFIDRNTPDSAIVASEDEAAIMYYSQRNMLGLLGLSNPEIATGSFQPLSEETVEPAFRRRGYLSIYKNRPDILLFHEAWSDAPEKNASLTQDDIGNTIRTMFPAFQITTAYYRAGSMDALKKMGYRHISIAYSDIIFSIFVHDKIHDEFITKLMAAGFKNLGTDLVPYEVERSVSSRYLPAAPEMIPDL